MWNVDAPRCRITLAGLAPTGSIWVPPMRPPGDADLEARDFSSFSVPACSDCDGLLKPDVVFFFGEIVPRDVVHTAGEHLQRADAMLIVGSSLMVYSGFRFVRMAARAGSRSLL
jgi:NAD-dependent SIR2 family protein deacetylase